MSIRAAAILLVALALGPEAASAHQKSISHSSWDVDGRHARVVLRIPRLELTRLPWANPTADPLDAVLMGWMSERLQLLAGDEACAITSGPRSLQTTPDVALVEWEVDCPEAGALRVRSDLFREEAPGHLHFALVRTPGARPFEGVLAGSQRSWAFEPPEDATGGERVGASLGSYVLLGVEHIWSGWDHLAFLLALLLLAARAREVAFVVTGFTVAHSITLGVAVLGLVRPETRPVEALIGLSIALVATENAWALGGRPRAVPWLVAGALGVAAVGSLSGLGGLSPAILAGLALFTLCYFGLVERASAPARLRFCIAFAFGLVHGFGFAGVLAQVELPPDRIAPALFGFNIGVELGQLAIVAVVWPALHLLRASRASAHRFFVEAASAAVCGLGLFWLVARAYG